MQCPFCSLVTVSMLLKDTRYVEKRRAVAQMVHKVKNGWFQQKAKDVELRVLPGESGVHRCIYDI